MRPDDEDEIRHVLRAGPRPTTMTSDEMARIIARLERDASEPAGPTQMARPAPAGTGALVVSTVDAGDRDHHRHRPGRRLRLLAVAAAALILTLVAGLMTIRSEPEIEPAAAPDVPPACPVSWNDERLVPLRHALDEWRTVENWAFTRGEPDLGDLVRSALAAASAMPDTDRSQRADTALENLTGSLSSIDDTSIVDSLAAAETRLDAVQRGIDAVNDIIRSFDERCDLQLIPTGS